MSGLAGVWIGARLTAHRETEKRRHEFIERQLREFYSPILSIRMEIHEKCKLRVRIGQIADEAWRKLCAERRASGIQALETLQKERSHEFKAIVDHENRQLREALLPAYRRMAEIFRENRWLAETETQEFFSDLIEFIDIWDRYISNSLPYEVLVELGHSEEKLDAFYNHVRDMNNKLRTAIATD